MLQKNITCMILDGDEIEKSVSKWKKPVRLIYSIVYLSIILITLTINYYIFTFINELNSTFSVSDLAGHIKNLILLNVLLIILTLFGFMKSIWVNNYLKLIGFLIIIFSFFLILNPMMHNIYERIN